MAAGLVLSALLSGASPVQDAAPPRPRIEATRTLTPPRIDGSLEDEAWEGPALALDDWLTYNPLNGERLEQTTDVRVVYDDRSIFFAFRCLDPEPEKVRSTLSRRDQLWNDDWVGLSLDSVGNGQRSYDLFVNAAGVQADILTTPSAGENTAPDWVWESAGRRTSEGYEVEIRVPLTTIRFKNGSEVRMGILFWRRVSRLGMSASWPEVPAGKSAIERHATLMLHDLSQPLTLEVIPSVTYSRRQTRVSPDTFGPVDSDPDAGISVKYGVTSSATIEGTVNPDFSQVESDAFQVEVNRRFPVFFAEKRPFFMEGMGTFELAGTGGDANMRTAVHTRVIEDPLWGGKASGTAGRATFALLAAGDEAPGRQLPGEDENPFPGERKGYFIARGQYSIGRTNYVGALLTDAEFAGGHNRTASADISLKLGNHFTSGTFLASATRSPDGLESKDGVAGQLFYAYETKPLVFVTQAEHYDTDFQMDTAFVNQTGVTQGWAYVAPSFYPDPEKISWLKRVVPFVFSRYIRDRVQGGDGWFVLPGIRVHTTRQGYVRFDVGWGEEAWAGRVFPIGSVRALGNAQLFRWLNVDGEVRFSRSIFYDEVDPYSGRERSYEVEVSLQPCSRLSQSVSWNHVKFDRESDGENVYTVDVLNTRTTFQFDRHFFLRAIIQYNSSRHQVLTDFLASWELLPGTLAYVGYGSILERRGWNGSSFTDEPEGNYLTSERGFFFKASYIHRF